MPHFRGYNPLHHTRRPDDCETGTGVPRGSTWPMKSAKWLDALRPDQRVADAARASLALRLREVRHFLKRAAWQTAEDVEHVHQLRVASRRATAALQLYAELLPEKQARSWKKRLRRVRRAAGAARDCDVLMAHFERCPAGPARKPILVLLEQARTEAQQPIVDEATQLLRGRRWRKHARRLRAELRGAVGEPADQPLASWAHGKLRDHVQAFLEAVPPPEADTGQLHRFRIQAKKLRYAAELLAAVMPPSLRSDVYPQVVVLQDQLGEINDAAERRRRLQSWSPTLPPPDALQHSRQLVRREQRAIAAGRRKFFAWWDERGPALCAALQTLFPELEFPRHPPTPAAKR